MARKLAAAVFSLGCLHSSTLMALGLGEMKLESFLNEPLKAKVDLLDTTGLHEDQVRIRLATKDDFDRLGVERSYFLTGIKFEIIIDGSGTGQILLSSDDPVLEPYLDFIIEARWPAGRLLREYTVLIDPPVFDESSRVVSASERVAEVEGIPAPTQKKSGPDAAVESGTRVRLDGSPRASDSGYGADTAAAPMAGNRYLIRRDDTLWDIASNARPDGVSVHQTMLDIQRLNPDAFIDGNINRIKAGYIIYLPNAGDISSANTDAALAEVREQNALWREQQSSGEPRDQDSGPSLRISADPTEEGAEAVERGEAPGAAATAAMQETIAKTQLERDEAQQRLAAVEEQLQTMERIVAVKDDQIAALQGELAGLRDGAESPVPAPTPAASDQAPGQPVAVTTPTAVPEPAPTGGLPGWLPYALGGLVAGIGGLWFFRRRRAGETGEAVAAESVPEQVDDVFADVELLNDDLEIDDSAAEPEAPRQAPAASSAAVAPAGDPLSSLAADMAALAPADEAPGEPAEKPAAASAPDADSRGYGQRKHDEYASDVGSGDALAEADIYIAYGRYPQAIELLNNALAADPDNAAFRLKLLGLHVEMVDRGAAEEQYRQLQAIGHPGTIAEADTLMEQLAAAGEGVTTRIPAQAGAASAQAASLSDRSFIVEEGEDNSLELELGGMASGGGGADFNTSGGEVLEADFSGLEIEEERGALADDLDLSADFNDTPGGADAQDEDMVFATEGSEMSTKLDLARAYLDMGDEDGARQILEEVASEGSGEQKEEARLLLQRLD